MIEKRLLFGRGRRENKPALIAISMICTVTASCLTAAVSARPPEKTPVIIGFKEKPDPDLILAYGGEIKSIYTIIPAIAGKVPRSKVSKLAEEESEDYVEEDLVVRVLNATATWNINKVKAPEVWNKSVSGSGVIVAILDTGVNYCLSDLDTNYLGGYDFYNKDTDPMDDDGHGTSMSCPHVSRAVALLVQQNGGNIDPDLARQIVKDGADDLGYNKPTQGSGLLNTLNNYNLL